MKKSIRHTWAVCLASLLSVSAVLPAFGEEDTSNIHGWQQEEDGRWIYLDSNGDKKTSIWIRGNDGNQYYLDENGYMAVNSIVEDGDYTYYVDENGIRVTNRWVSQPNEDGACDQEVETLWYYMDAKGRAKKDREKKPVRLTNQAGEVQKFFFDEDGHMLSGWHKVENEDGNGYKMYYLGDENQGHAHTQWQYLIPSEDEEILADPSKNYDGYEMFYFGWDGEMSKNEDAELEGHHFAFDENGVMVTGWAPGVTSFNPNEKNDSDGDNFGINRYYDEATGIRASGWLYASDPDDEGSNPHWFYCDPDDGYLYNEGGRDSDRIFGWKKIDGQAYFFDQNGYLVTGLISTGGNDISGSPFMESEFDYGEDAGPIGKGSRMKPAGIYYLSQNEATLGQMVHGKRIVLSLDGETATYHFHERGWAYTNALVDGRIYGDDGEMLKADSSGWETFVMDKPIYDEKDIQDRSQDGERIVGPEEGAVPLIEVGETVIIDKSGKVKKKGSVKVSGTRYDIGPDQDDPDRKNYVAAVHPEEA